MRTMKARKSLMTHASIKSLKIKHWALIFEKKKIKQRKPKVHTSRDLLRDIFRLQVI